MLPGWCCIAIAALELGNIDSWYHMCAFRFHFWGRKVNWNQASHVRASSVPTLYACCLLNAVVIFCLSAFAVDFAILRSHFWYRTHASKQASKQASTHARTHARTHISWRHWWWSYRAHLGYGAPAVNEPHPHIFFLVLVGGHPLKNSTGMDHSPNFLAQIEKQMKSWNHQIVNQLNLKHTNLLLHTSSLLSFEKTHDSFSGSGSPRRLFCLVTWRICVSIYIIYKHTRLYLIYIYTSICYILVQ